MKVATVIARVLLGLIFVVFGSNAFLHFLPMPPLPQGVTGEYLHAFFASGYVYVIGGLQVIGGLLLLLIHTIVLARLGTAEFQFAGMAAILGPACMSHLPAAPRDRQGRSRA